MKEKVYLQNNIKVYSEPVPFLTVNQDQIITSTSSNKVGIHSNIENQNQVKNYN
jgi:hypothetical protein